MTHLSMQTPGHLSSANPYYFDGSGERVGDGGLEHGSVGQQILGALHPIHFGWFGGTLIKIAYGLLGLALTIVTHTGVTIWLHRKREKGNPEPFWERIWAALAWSQPFALAAAALVVLAAAPNLVLASYLVCFGLALVIGYVAPGETACARILRLLTGLTLCAVAVAHVATFGSEGMADPLAWIIDGLLVGCGLILMAGVLMPYAKLYISGRMTRKPTYPNL